MQKLGLPIPLIAWTSSFIEDRLLHLSLDGETEKFSKIEVGIPQGSPISPILFLIYTRDLFTKLDVQRLSYIDNICLITESIPIQKNVRTLEQAAQELYNLGQNNAIAFDLPKTDLMHFVKSTKERLNLVLLDGQIVESKEKVKWLGFYLDPHLTFKNHIATRASQAKQAFYRMERLANTGQGLSTNSLQQLY